MPSRVKSAQHHFWTELGVNFWGFQNALEEEKAITAKTGVADACLGKVLLPSQERALISLLDLKDNASGKDHVTVRQQLVSQLTEKGYITSTSTGTASAVEGDDTTPKGQALEVVIVDKPEGFSEVEKLMQKCNITKSTHAIKMFNKDGMLVQEEPEPEDFPVKVVLSEKVKLRGTEVVIRVFKDGNQIAYGFPIVVDSVMYFITAAQDAWDKSAVLSFEYKMEYGKGNVFLRSFHTEEDGSVVEDEDSASNYKFPPVKMEPDTYFRTFSDLHVTVTGMSHETVQMMEQRDLPAWNYNIDTQLYVGDAVSVLSCGAESLPGQAFEGVVLENNPEGGGLGDNGRVSCEVRDPSFFMTNGTLGGPGYIDNKGVVLIHTMWEHGDSGISIGGCCCGRDSGDSGMTIAAGTSIEAVVAAVRQTKQEA